MWAELAFWLYVIPAAVVGLVVYFALWGDLLQWLF
jgi:hypothetical protein